MVQLHRGTNMAHKHTCLNCDVVIEEGNFDCELDRDHDYRVCDDCENRAREDLAQDVTTLSRTGGTSCNRSRQSRAS